MILYIAPRSIIIGKRMPLTPSRNKKIEASIIIGETELVPINVTDRQLSILSEISGFLSQE